MATIVSKFVPKVTNPVAYGRMPVVRVIDRIVDFTTENAVGATDDLTLFTLPKGTVVLALGIEQITAGVDATNTLVVRLGTTAYTGTLTANAAAGTFAGSVVSTANPNQILTADTTVNLLSAVAARTTGKVRVFAVVVEATVPQVPQEVDRDVLA